MVENPVVEKRGSVRAMFLLTDWLMKSGGGKAANNEMQNLKEKLESGSASSDN